MTRAELIALRDALHMVLEMPERVRAEVARWLAPQPSRPNRHDLHPPPIAIAGAASPRGEVSPRESSPSRAPPSPSAEARRGNAVKAQAGERRLLAAMQASPGMGAQGRIEKDGPRPMAHRRRRSAPYDAAVAVTAEAEAKDNADSGDEVDRAAPTPAAAHAPWVRSISSYGGKRQVSSRDADTLGQRARGRSTRLSRRRGPRLSWTNVRGWKPRA